MQRIAQVAYKIQLPESSKIHPVIHVSQLKKALPLGVQLSTDVELDLPTSFSSLMPTQVIECCQKLVGAHLHKMMLVQREGCLAHWACWENKPTPDGSPQAKVIWAEKKAARKKAHHFVLHGAVSSTISIGDVGAP